MKDYMSEADKLNTNLYKSVGRPRWGRIVLYFILVVWVIYRLTQLVGCGVANV